MVEEYILGFAATPLILFIIGMIKPGWVIRWGEEENKTRKNVVIYYGGAIFVLFLLFTLASLVEDGKINNIADLFENIAGFAFGIMVYILIIGLVKPSWVTGYLKEEEKTRINVLRYYGLALVALFSVTIAFSALSDLIEKNKLFTVLPILLIYIIYKLLDEQFDIKDKYLDIRSK